MLSDLLAHNLSGNQEIEAAELAQNLAEMQDDNSIQRDRLSTIKESLDEADTEADLNDKFIKLKDELSELKIEKESSLSQSHGLAIKYAEKESVLAQQIIVLRQQIGDLKKEN